MITLTDLITGPVDVREPLQAGSLLLFPVFTDVPAAPAYLCGPQAAGLLEIDELLGGEGAVVPELAVRFTGGLPLLLLEGETLLGNKQNRTLNVSVLCPAGAAVQLPVSCVEAGRWGMKMASRRSPNLSPTGLRAAKTRTVGEAVRRFAHKRSDQSLVWDHVAAYSERHHVGSPTSALEDVSAAVGHDVAELVRGLRPAEGQRGVVVVAGDRVVSLDLFDKPETLTAYWDGLLAGYALEAVDAAPRPFTLTDAAAFVDRVLASPAARADGAALGEELHLGGDGRLSGSALVWDGAVVHLAAFETA